MGIKLVRIFDIVSEKKGLDGRITLAEATGISKSAAAQVDDKPEILKKVKDEASVIIGESIDKYL